MHFGLFRHIKFCNFFYPSRIVCRCFGLYVARFSPFSTLDAILTSICHDILRDKLSTKQTIVLFDVLISQSLNLIQMFSRFL